MENNIIVEFKDGRTFKVSFISFDGTILLGYCQFLYIKEDGRKGIGSIEVSKLKSITTVK